MLIFQRLNFHKLIYDAKDHWGYRRSLLCLKSQIFHGFLFCLTMYEYCSYKDANLLINKSSILMDNFCPCFMYNSHSRFCSFLGLLLFLELRKISQFSPGVLLLAFSLLKFLSYQ